MISWKTVDTHQPIIVSSSPDKDKAFKAYLLIPKEIDCEGNRGMMIGEYNGDGRLFFGVLYYNMLLCWNSPVDMTTNNDKNLQMFKMLEASGEIKYPLKIISEEGFNKGLTYEDFEHPSELDPNDGWVYQDPVNN